MCSQFNLNIQLDQLINFTNSSLSSHSRDLKWHQDIYPYSPAPVIINQNNNTYLQLMNYSLIPAWSQVAKPKFATYNARLDRPGKLDQLELIYEAPAWRQPFRKQRCLVPMTGFYESCKVGTHAGNIVKFESANHNTILLAAGIWDKWTDYNSGEIINSFAILTDEPVPFIREVGHDRQPVFLTQANAEQWLNTKELPPIEAYSFLKSNQMAINYKVKNERALKGYNTDSLF